MPLKSSNNSQCFCLTKTLGKDASMMYKSLTIIISDFPVNSWDASFMVCWFFSVNASSFRYIYIFATFINEKCHESDF